ncbi:REP-associated tyrosine transposase [Rufibacter quisquiliarum]|uniref:REP element-mobilizing transposase RayT n=1 Tax=Rufibacter quisquiliarum TaxID=1549639 RepID=A0A839GKJ8_9BACT|nr:transposase [Rufibacter quisquiliarum]MBA9075546.1 REP element-mobilizing transposase RayT [Rufibacter quisquiliarum]
MSTKYKTSNPEGIYFLSMATVEWVDVFTRREYCEIVVASLRFCIERKGLILHAWVIMPNHLHLIASAAENKELTSILRDFKKFTATQLLTAIQENPAESRKRWMQWIFQSNGARNSQNRHHQFWQQSNHPQELDSNYLMSQKLDYLHQNPVKTGLVEEPAHWRYSSATDYAGGKGLLSLVFLE